MDDFAAGLYITLDKPVCSIPQVKINETLHKSDKGHLEKLNYKTENNYVQENKKELVTKYYIE